MDRGAFLKTTNSGIFIGFDEESELGAFSSQVDLNSEGDFVFGDLAKFKGSDFLVPTSGVGRALLANRAKLVVRRPFGRWIRVLLGSLLY